MSRIIKPIVYVFCEGKTEENYFKQLSRVLNIRSFQVRTFDLEGGTDIMDHPEKVKRTIEGKLKHDKIKGLTEQIFVVFDLDIYKRDKHKLENTMNILKDYELIISNEVFEYFILSHFKKYNVCGGKEKYMKELKFFLPGLPELPYLKKYKMTDIKDFDWLDKENIKLAVKNTKEVNEENSDKKSIIDKDPYSDVYKIIEFLEKK